MGDPFNQLETVWVGQGLQEGSAAGAREAK
jgi:hypothetical protein